MNTNSMTSYIAALTKYKSFVGLKETGALVFSILATKFGLTPNKRSQRLMNHWSSFRLLAGEKKIHVLAVRDPEFELSYEPDQSGKNQIKMLLRVPVSESSDVLVFNQIFVTQEYQHVLDWFSSVGPRQEIGTIVDLGGNIGCAALFFSTQFPAASIFSLEPEASNYGRLRLNLELNSDRKIKSYHAAIWTQSCKLQCVHDFRDKKESSSRFVKLSEAKDVSTQPVDALSIRSLMEMAGFKQIDLLKIDIEGAEAVLFRDADFQNFLKENVLRVAVEVHEEFIKIKEVEAVLHTLGYETNAVDEFLCGIKRKL